MPVVVMAIRNEKPAFVLIGSMGEKHENLAMERLMLVLGCAGRVPARLPAGRRRYGQA